MTGQLSEPGRWAQKESLAMRGEEQVEGLRGDGEKVELRRNEGGLERCGAKGRRWMRRMRESHREAADGNKTQREEAALQPAALSALTLGRERRGARGIRDSGPLIHVFKRNPLALDSPTHFSCATRHQQGASVGPEPAGSSVQAQTSRPCSQLT